MLRRRTGFTLIELLVVIAIIGILAAMLFPVFARAREAARKTQCLANVKNLAMAMQIYFTDFDAFPPHETNPEVISYFTDRGGLCVSSPTVAVGRATASNPYLRWPVVLDEYVKSREVWRCPSAKITNHAQPINPSIGNWFDWVGPKSGVNGCCTCTNWWPAGWGGTLTDSTNFGTGISYDWDTGNPSGFEYNYGVPTYSDADMCGKNLSTINDPTKLIVISEAPRLDAWSAVQIAYPDTCRADITDYWLERDGHYDQTCANNDHEEGWITKFWTQPDFRKQFARHMGGDNLGFADGHAKWWPAEAIISGLGDYTNRHPQLEPYICLCREDNPNR